MTLKWKIFLAGSVLIAAVALSVPLMDAPAEAEHNGACFGSHSVVIEKVPDAENQLFTSDGRYLVTGGKNAYEVSRLADGSYSSRELFRDPAGLLFNYFLGIVELNGYVYAAYYTGLNSYLTAMPLNGTSPSLSIIHELSVTFPNGMGVNPRGDAMYLADMLKSNIIRIRVDRSNPTRVIEERVVLSSGISRPNGMKYYDGNLFVSNSDTIFSIPVDANGDLGAVTVVFKLRGLVVFLDDFTFVNNGNWIAIAEYTGNRVLVVDRFRGTTVCDSGRAFSGPSSVLLSQNRFDAGKLLVTEKGILYDMISSIGNRVGQIDFTTSL